MTLPGHACEASAPAGAARPEAFRTVRVGDEDFLYPSFVHRVRHGWQLRFKRVPSLYFADSTHGGARQSLNATLAAREQQWPVVEAMRAAVAAAPRERSLGLHEQSRKALKTGVVGVYLSARANGRGRITSYSLTISCPGHKSRHLYVGTDATWPARLAARLDEAKAIREHFVQQHAAAKATDRRRGRTAPTDAPAAAAAVRRSGRSRG